MNEELLLALGRLEGKVDSLITSQAVHAEELARLDKRIRELEQSKSWVLGAAAVVGAVVSFLVQFLKP
tara:strand:- start:2383 stop:2586 length:204 start_codon:yes stop_codon:yes gene_type:complete